MLQGMGWSEFDAARAREHFFEADRHALSELAEVWDPDVPNLQNAAYVDRAKAVNEDLYTSFLSNLTQVLEVEGAQTEQRPKDD